jgi:hypothetical protein
MGPATGPVERGDTVKRALILLLVVSLLLLALAVPALAGPPGHGEKAFGKGITFHCGMPYGQLVKASPHDFPPSGARAFAEVLAAHCLTD